MHLGPEDRPRPGGRLALRIAVLGGVAVALFAVLFFRLWGLQVLSGQQYLAEAKNNRTREYRTIAPRGDILDREGNVLVDNRTSLALQLNMQKLPQEPAAERAELARLGKLAHMTLPKVRRRIAEEEKVAAGAPITLRRDVGYDLVYYLQENQARFPGVQVQRVFVRGYPDGSRAAHILGSVGEVSEEELKKGPYRSLEPGDEVGQSGTEAAYDRYLRGTPGLTKIQVNALGEPTPGGQLVSNPPTPGDSLKLTIDPEVQAAGESALASRGLRGAFVTMNVNNGQILGLGSFPTFDPSVFTPPVNTAKYESLNTDEAAPLTDRATEAAYPTGSTFKVITALAALESGVITPSTTIEDAGKITVGNESFSNAGGVANGPLTLVPALEVSSDVFFYTLGLDMWKNNELQRWAGKLGIGRPSGLDIPEGLPGLVPNKKWRDALAAEGLAEGRPWSAGDNIQLATGQGDLQTNPLQMAIAYAALGNGGNIVTPHVGMEVEDAAGRVIKEFDPPVRRHIHIDPGYREAIMEGLHDAAQSPAGTSYSVFGGFPVEVAGKTGTAQRPPHLDQSWYVVLAPYPNPRIVTAVTMEEGGFGVESAAPAALQILESYFNKHASAVSGSSSGAE
jgi:penicillin-binding protein 2